MSTVCRKLRFLVIFMIFYFIVCRIQEFFSMRHGWDWLGLVDPVKVRVSALKAVLARRGISSELSIERQDLVDLVRGSGRLTGGELAEVSGTNQSQNAGEPKTSHADIESSVTSFANAAHFDELVEDCKDSAWLVEIRQNGAPVLPTTVWVRLNQYLRPFDIRIGRVECDKRTALCSRKAFHRSGLLLAMPRGRRRMKDTVVFSWFTSAPKLAAVRRWVEAALATRVPSLENGLTGLGAIRNGSASLNGDFIVALDFDRLPQVPLLFSALSVRFTGRVRFWRLERSDRDLLQNRSSEGPSLFLISGRSATAYEYGARLDGSETTSFRSLALFLKMNYPEANDTLIGLSYPVVMLALLSLALRQKSFLARIIAAAASLLGYGLLFLLLYLPAEHLLSLRSLQGARGALLSLCQVVSRSELGARIRRDCLAERYCPLRVGIWFAVFLCFVAIFESRRADEEEEEEEPSRHEEEHSRRPTPYIPEAAQMDHVVNYLYSSLWLPPDEWTKTYVDHLPVWSCTQELSCCSSDEETLVADEEAWHSGALFCRQCSVCLVDFRRGDVLCHLPCGHVFHERCVKRWLRHPDTDSCPVCRWPAFKVK